MITVEKHDSFFKGRKTSQITEEFPDKTKFPLYYEAKRQEFTINEGEMIFIPAGWWHFVFSEEPNPETRINYSINFWYCERPEWIEGKSCENYVPYVKNHEFTFNEINPTNMLKNRILIVNKSDNRCFVPAVLCHHYNNNQEVAYMNYETFLTMNEYPVYILENTLSDLEKYAPKMDTDVKTANFWINFGNVQTVNHYDGLDNWLCQIQGKKRLILFPPEEREKLYPINPYSLELVLSLMTDVVDNCILWREKVCDLEFCSVVLQEPLLEYTKSDIFFNSYHTLSEILKDYLKKRNFVLPSVQVPKQFKIIDARTSEYTTNDYAFGPYTFLWFMTDGIVLIKDYIKAMKKGHCVLFPTSYLYPWKVQGAVFVMPV